ncbi:oligosaccharide flippase family protein [Marnyiella aurantia]|uniref:Oligosaccharide flippase family protein n=1 Tax=Marnyiella aurantia TaxID=2758037 RepID=A0A7D7QWY7_9FLAO|nr:oligosaccharide flippase family protein [Marnyiella aurantia]MBA5247454.1 oligosaccharide flippase family protein [Marnyiella aurantia]QMS99210.1 oligosaccharide flippase family protein [Marnyiella aurantia]
MQNSSRQIKIGGMISYFTIAFSIIAGLIYTPWMISIIGQADFGLYTLATSLVTMVTIDLGLSAAVTRFVSKYKAQNDTHGISRFMGIAYKLFIGLAVIFLLLLTVMYFNVEHIFVKLNPDELGKVKVLLAVAGLYSVISFPFQPLDGLLFSGEWFIFHKITGLVHKVLNIVLMVGALIMGYGLYSLVVVNAGLGILLIIWKLYFLKKKDWTPINWKGFDSVLVKEIFSFSLWVMVISIAQRLILNITPSVLGMTSGSKEIAIFSAAMTIEGYVWTFATVFGSMFLPKVAQIIYKDDGGPEAIQELMIKVGRIQFIMLGAIVSIFLVAGKGFFLNWLGADFERSYLVAVFLILPGLLTIPQEIASTALVASNKVKFNAYSKIIIAAVSVVLSYLLSLRFGSTGAGFAIFIGNIVGGVIVMNIIYVRVLKINIWKFFKQCQVKMALPFILVVFIGLALNYFFPSISWTATIVKSVVLGLIYCFAAYFLALNNYEKDLVLGVIKRKIQ